MKQTISKFIASFGAISIVLMSAAAAVAQDAGNPSDVENLQGTALNEAVQLTWDPATDNVAVTGYQVHYGMTPVNQPGQSYDEVIDAGNVVNYTVDNLNNDTTYYFSVIAYDAEGNESVAWATEVAATPNATGGNVDDDDAPQVTAAEVLNKIEVKVVFSEPVSLPLEDPEDAFSIQNDDTFEDLAVIDAIFDEEDETEKTVILTTGVQTVGATYKLTVGIDIEDKAGNPVVSGTSDTAIFVGSGEEKAPEDAEGPSIIDVDVVDNTHIIVNFDETIVLSIDPSENFVIKAKNDASKELQVLGVELGVSTAGVEDAAAIITTSPQEDIDYTVEINGLKDEDDNVGISSDEFSGIGPDGTGNGDTVEDLIPPKDVANFLAKAVFEDAKHVVTLTWEIPEENIGDVVAQILYMSTDKGEEYEETATLDAEATEYEVSDLEAGEYWFKITQKDAAGNESEGVVSKVILSETGPGLVGLIAVSLGLGRVISRRRKN